MFPILKCQPLSWPAAPISACGLTHPPYLWDQPSSLGLRLQIDVYLFCPNIFIKRHSEQNKSRIGTHYTLEHLRQDNAIFNRQLENDLEKFNFDNYSEGLTYVFIQV